MIPTISSVLALTGLAAAALEPREIMHAARDVPSFIHHRDPRDSTSTPCGTLSEVYEAASKTPGKAVIVAVPPSIGVACLKSVPYDKEKDLELLDQLLRYVEFQSTTEILASPPDEYLFPGVDIYAGFEAIKTKLQNDEYETQYDIMTDLQTIYAAANDNHFNYSPALLHAFLYVRRGLNFVSISTDGVKLPQIYDANDVGRGNRGELDYHPSAIYSIDDVDVFEWLEQDAVYNIANYQDPDAQFNALFSSVASTAAHKDATALITSFEIPDNHTITFANGSTLVVHNEILFLPSTDFTGIANGEDFHEAFELPKAGEEEEEPQPTETPVVEPTKVQPKPTTRPTSSVVPGYPKPVTKHSANSVAGYFLDGEDYKDTAVLAILGFLPVGFDFADGNFNLTDFIIEATEVIVEFVEACKKDGRDKLIIDLSANGGGSVALAEQIYSLLFPETKWNVFDRFRANLALEAASEADFQSLVQQFVTASNYYPLDPDGKPMKDGKAWFGPEAAGGQNMTAAFHGDNSRPWNVEQTLYLNGQDEDSTYFKEAPFKAENMLIVTDGTCASACGILTGYLTRNHGVRTLALGGRAIHYAMQAMGGVKGTRLSFNYSILQVFIEMIKANSKNDAALSILNDAADSLPKFEQLPLLPALGPGSGGQVNSLNGYTDDDLDGIPVHFRYEAANCKLFYTQRMTFDITEAWRAASAVGWKGASCVVGSSVNSDGTIGTEVLAYDSNVRSRSYAIEGPGALA